MVRRTIKRVKLERMSARIDQAMACARRRQNGVVALDRVHFAVNHDLPIAFFDPEQLIAVFMRLVADFLPRLERHEDKLQMFPGLQHMPEILVIFRNHVNVVNKTLHEDLLLLQSVKFQNN